MQQQTLVYTLEKKLREFRSDSDSRSKNQQGNQTFCKGKQSAEHAAELLIDAQVVRGKHKGSTPVLCRNHVKPIPCYTPQIMAGKTSETS